MDQNQSDGMFPVVKRLYNEHLIMYKSRIMLSVFFMILVALCTALLVKIIKPIIDQVFVTRDQTALISLSIAAFCISVFKGVAEFFQSFLIKYVGQRVLTDLQMRLYNHLLHSDLSLIMKESSGRLISRFTNDISLMRGAVSNFIVGMAKHLLSVIFLICVMFYEQPKLSIMIFGLFPLIIMPVQIIGRKIRIITGKAQEELGNYTAKLDETFKAIRVIKASSAEDLEQERAHAINQRILYHFKQNAKYDALISPIMESLSGLATAGILWYGGMQVIEGSTTPGALMAFITAFVSAYRPYKSLIALNVNLQEGISAGKRIFKILDTKPKITDSVDAKEYDLSDAKIEFRNVHFSFAGKIILDDISFSVEKGKTIALVGASGSGKTTCANLLCRFFDPIDGDIFVNDINIKDFKLSSLRNHISLVTQDVLLFDSTVKENIVYASKNKSIDDIKKVAKITNAFEFIEKLEDGFETHIGEYGHMLSGGQRQRLALARCMLKDAPIMVLDEATSSLDSISEEIINQAIKTHRKDKTNIIISHKLSSIINADYIYVISKGKITQSGTYDELKSDQEGDFYRLFIK